MGRHAGAAGPWLPIIVTTVLPPAETIATSHRKDDGAVGGFPRLEAVPVVSLRLAAGGTDPVGLVAVAGWMFFFLAS